VTPAEARRKALELARTVETYKDPEARRIMTELVAKYMELARRLEALQ
jgi:hypothetical protein